MHLHDLHNIACKQAVVRSLLSINTPTTNDQSNGVKSTYGNSYLQIHLSAKCQAVYMKLPRHEGSQRIRAPQRKLIVIEDFVAIFFSFFNKEFSNIWIQG